MLWNHNLYKIVITLLEHTKMAPNSVGKVFLKKAVRVGNSAGVLLPRALLGSDVRVTVLTRPMNIKKDIIKLLTPVFEDILGIYLIEKKEDSAEILAVSTKVNKHIDKPRYFIDIVPISILKRSIKEKKETKEKITKAKPIMNKKLLKELREIKG